MNFKMIKYTIDNSFHVQTQTSLFKTMKYNNLCGKSEHLCNFSHHYYGVTESKIADKLFEYDSHVSHSIECNSM